MNTQHIITMIVATIIIAGASFWGGTTYAQAKTSGRGGQFAQFVGGQGGRGGNGAFRGGPGGMNAAFGTIILKDANSITVQLGAPNATSTNGSASGTKMILVDTSTEVSKTVSGSLSDLKIGESVVASGSVNSDGSVTAQMIQIRPVSGRTQ